MTQPHAEAGIKSVRRLPPIEAERTCSGRSRVSVSIALPGFMRADIECRLPALFDAAHGASPYTVIPNSGSGELTGTAESVSTHDD